jgi:hypothetical protein
LNTSQYVRWKISHNSSLISVVSQILFAHACCNRHATRFRICLPFFQTKILALLPTALVHASDLFGLPVPTSPTMSCRTYAGDLPSVREIAAKLRAARAP